MLSLYERIEDLCKSEGITMTEMCRRAKVPRGNLTDLNKGRQKSLAPKNLQKIADYFNVSVDYLLTGIKKEPTILEDDELNEYLELLRSRPECRVLLSTVKGATKAEVEENVRFITAMRQAKNSND